MVMKRNKEMVTRMVEVTEEMVTSVTHTLPAAARFVTAKRLCMLPNSMHSANKIRDAASIIASELSWCETPEGADFWTDVYQRLVFISGK